MRNILHDLGIVPSIAQAAHAAPVQGASIDVTGIGAAGFAAVISAVGGAGGTLTLEHSHDNAAWVAVPAAEAQYHTSDNGSIGTNTLQANKTTFAAYLGARRYVRPVLTPNTSATGYVAGVSGLADRMPLTGGII